MSLLGVDFGTRIIGLAIGQEISKDNFSVSPLEPLSDHSQTELLKNLKQICRDYGVGTIVFGLPYLKDGKEGPLSGKIRQFSQDFLSFYNQKFAESKINLQFVDESLTSFEAAKLDREIQASRRRKKEVINSLAAVLILENYLGSLLKG